MLAQAPNVTNAPHSRPGLTDSNDALWRYWNELPKQDSVPRRADFDPMRIPAALPDISILERLAAECWKIRVVGTRLGNRVGMNTTGMNYLDLVGEANRALVRDVLSLLVRTPCGFEGERLIRVAGGLTIPIQALLLPLRVADGEIRLLISASSRLTPPTLRKSAVVEDIEFVSGRLIDIGAGLPATRLLT